MSTPTTDAPETVEAGPKRRDGAAGRHRIRRDSKTRLVEWRPGLWMPEPREDDEQAAYFDALPLLLADSDRALVYAVPNGVPKVPRLQARFKRTGLKSGVPDIHWPVARGGYHGLWIEMKRVLSGRPTDAEDEWLLRLSELGHAAFVCRGRYEAMAATLWYASLAATCGQVPVDSTPDLPRRLVESGVYDRWLDF